MKKFRNLYSILALISFLVLGCSPREDTKQPKADFNFDSTSDIAPGDEVTFTNASTDAETFSWDFDDKSPLSVAPNPKHVFEAAGEYDVTLTVQNKNLKDQISKKVTVVSAITACFTIAPTTVVVGKNLHCTNCSEGAESYEWYQVGYNEIVSTLKDPDFTFSTAGTFEIKLIAKSGSSSAEVVHPVTVVDGNPNEIDPTIYDLGDIWKQHYYNDFSESGDWYEGSGDDYTLTVANGMYTMVDKNDADDHYGYYVAYDGLDLPVGNYDYEARIKNRVDNASWGSGLIYGGLGSDFNYFKFSIGLYRIGDTGDGDWLEWTATTDGNVEDWNLLTVRKYENKYYFFINEVFLYEDDYNNYANEFGFAFDKNTTVDIDAVGIYIMDLSGKKSGSIKQKINTESKSKTSKIKLAPKDYNPLK